MREILFKGKTKFDNKWVEGTLDNIDEPFRIGSRKKDGRVSFRDVRSVTVGEYTGINDKNGKRIFENDIVQYGDRVGIVNYRLGCFCVHTTKPDYLGRNNPAIDIILNEYPNEITVVGNIYDGEEGSENEN